MSDKKAEAKEMRIERLREQVDEAAVTYFASTDRLAILLAELFRLGETDEMMDFPWVEDFLDEGDAGRWRDLYGERPAAVIELVRKRRPEESEH